MSWPIVQLQQFGECGTARAVVCLTHDDRTLARNVVHHLRAFFCFSFFRSNCPAHSPLTRQRQSRSAEATCGSFLAVWSSEALKELSLRLKRRLTVALSDQELIGVTFKDADGRMLEVTGVHPKFPGLSYTAT